MAVGHGATCFVNAHTARKTEQPFGAVGCEDYTQAIPSSDASFHSKRTASLAWASFAAAHATAGTEEEVCPDTTVVAAAKPALARILSTSVTEADVAVAAGGPLAA